MKHFIVIDMQNDFCTGTLKNDMAVAIIPTIKKLLKKARENGYSIIFTRDTHQKDYLTTGEGKHLPVEHCIKGTEGWNIVSELEAADSNAIFIDKSHFGYPDWKNYIAEGDEVIMCGTCTDICVISNSLAIKMIENVEVTVISDACAGLTRQKHENALDVMASCQCNLKTAEEILEGK